MAHDRITRYRAFAARFAVAGELKPIGNAVIAESENQLGSRLPRSWKVFATEIGVGSASLLGDAWSAAWSADAARACPIPWEQVWHPAEIVRQCDQPWLAPIPAELPGGPADSDVAWDHLLPFGRDSNSSWWHCFPRQPHDADDLPVYLFDHDGGDIDRIAGGLDELIDLYLRLPDPP